VAEKGEEAVEAAVMAAGVDAAEGTHTRAAGMRMAASYVNYYLGTRRIVAPLLDPQHDGAALRRLQSLFPRREVVGVPGREILLGGGHIHCVTQQVPRRAA
jgi:agmatine deiminase